MPDVYSFSRTNLSPPLQTSTPVPKYTCTITADNTFAPENLEKIWKQRYSFFLRGGFQLRPYYKPDDSEVSQFDPILDDESDASSDWLIPHVLDAVNTRNKAPVCIKMVFCRMSNQEVDISRYLSSERMQQHSRNHCVPLHAIFQDPLFLDVRYLVMPLLRPFDQPEFVVVGEVMDFVTQILEGMDFLHSLCIAHGDLTGVNIMMDGRPLYPGGWHPVDIDFSPDRLTILSPLRRIDHPVRYYIIDFGISHWLNSNQSVFVKDLGGRDTDVPELAVLKPYNPFKVDVFTVANVLRKDFYWKYMGLDFLKPLIAFMMTDNPRERPSASDALKVWTSNIRGAGLSSARSRLRKRNETFGERVVMDTVAAAHQSVRVLSGLFA